MKNSGYSEEEVNSFLSVNLEEHKLITFEFGTGFQYGMLTSISGFHLRDFIKNKDLFILLEIVKDYCLTQVPILLSRQ